VPSNGTVLYRSRNFLTPMDAATIAHSQDPRALADFLPVYQCRKNWGNCG